MKFRIFIISLFSLIVGELFSQDYFRSAYYLQSYRYRHEMNPSFQPERGYVGIPILGCFSTNFSSNVATRNIFSALHESSLSEWEDCINSSTLKSMLKPQNKLDVNVDLSLFNIGFFAFEGFNSISYSLKTDLRGNFPKELIDVLSQSPTPGENINLENLKMRSSSFMEVALGHSHLINEKVSVGAKVKLLLGLLNVNTKIDEMNFSGEGEHWKVQGQGVLDISGFFDIPTSNRYLNEMDFGDVSIDYDHLISGVGVAADFGVNYDINDNWQVNMALLNLGFMKWNKTYSSRLDVEAWTFEGFDNVKNASSDEELEDAVSSLWNSAKECFKFKGVNQTQTKEFLNLTLNLGVQYTLPIYDKLTFGFLSSSKFNAGYSWFEGRLSANVAPAHWFDGSLSYGLSTFGSSLGMVADFHPADFSVMIGMNLPLHIHLYPFDSSQKLFGDFYFGFNFPIGERKEKEKAIRVESFYESDSNAEKMQEMKEMEVEPQNIIVEE